MAFICGCHVWIQEVGGLKTVQVIAVVDLPGGRTVTLVGSRGAARDDFDAAARACLPDAGGTLDVSPLISHVLSLEAAPRVLDELGATGRIDGRPALRAVLDLRLDGDVTRAVAAGDELPAVHP